MNSEKNKERVLTAIIFMVGVIATLLLLFMGENYGLENSDIFANIIQIWICVGAFISVVYVVSSYRQTNRAFFLSQKPHLLVFVNNGQVSSNQKLLHQTTINYNNTSPNPFYDLSFSVKVKTKNTSVDLSDLFTEKMFVAAWDQRNRRFITQEELRKRGFNIEDAQESSQEIILSIAYTFTYIGKEQKVKIQEYFWDTRYELPQWTIK